MKQGNWVSIFGIALIGIGLIGVLLSNLWLARLVFVLIAIMGGYTYYKFKANQQRMITKVGLDKQLQESHVEMLGTINHLRHDWMNDIQVLFGYIQLKKYEHLTPYMDKIKMKMQQESLLSKLGVPSLVAYLLAFRVHSRSMQLEVGLEQEINLQLLPLNAELAADLVKDTVEMFKGFSVFDEQAEVGVLSLEFDVREDHLLLDFVYQGTFHREGLERAVKQRLADVSDVYSIAEHEFREEEAVLALRLPYRT
jgi:stage 0 sporulation protein B (sporulation initiation phosphotransferase)